MHPSTFRFLTGIILLLPLIPKQSLAAPAPTPAPQENSDPFNWNVPDGNWGEFKSSWQKWSQGGHGYGGGSGQQNDKEPCSESDGSSSVDAAQASSTAPTTSDTSPTAPIISDTYISQPSSSPDTSTQGGDQQGYEEPCPDEDYSSSTEASQSEEEPCPDEEGSPTSQPASSVTSNSYTSQSSSSSPPDNGGNWASSWSSSWTSSSGNTDSPQTSDPPMTIQTSDPAPSSSAAPSTIEPGASASASPSSGSGSGSGSTSGLSEEESKVLAAHNYARQLYNAPALEWNTTLVADAGGANDDIQCRAGDREGKNPGDPGHNYYATSEEDHTLVDGLQAWMNENTTYVAPQGKSQPVNFDAWGHFSQVLWGNTTSLGCKRSVCGSDSTPNKIWSSYYPPGNMLGEYAANVKVNQQVTGTNVLYANVQ